VKAKKWILNNIGLKVLSLALAVSTWFYINKELEKVRNEEERAIFSMLNYEVAAKRLPIKLTLVGKPPEGYSLDSENLTIAPETCVVMGPEKILQTVEYARTIPIDITEYTKSIKKRLPLGPIAEGISLKEFSVDVYIPIVKEVTQEEETEKE